MQQHESFTGMVEGLTIENESLKANVEALAMELEESKAEIKKLKDENEMIQLEIEEAMEMPKIAEGFFLNFNRNTFFWKESSMSWFFY